MDARSFEQGYVIKLNFSELYLASWDAAGAHWKEGRRNAKQFDSLEQAQGLAVEYGGTVLSRHAAFEL